VTPREQIDTKLPGGTATAISGSAELERGARGALLADRAFRLDACPMGDTLKLVLRGLDGAQLKSRSGGYSGEVIVREEQLTQLRERRPCRFDLTVEILEGGVLRRASILVGAVHFAERGVTRLTAQALVCPAE
jgi:hypothetical protein